MMKQHVSSSVITQSFATSHKNEPFTCNYYLNNASYKETDFSYISEIFCYYH